MHFPMKIHILNEKKNIEHVEDTQSCGHLVHKEPLMCSTLMCSEDSEA